MTNIFLKIDFFHSLIISKRWINLCFFFVFVNFYGQAFASNSQAITITGGAIVYEEENGIVAKSENNLSQKTERPNLKKQVKRSPGKLVVKKNSNSHKNHNFKSKKNYNLPSHSEFFNTSKSSLSFTLTTNSFVPAIIFAIKKNENILRSYEETESNLYNFFYRGYQFKNTALIRPPPHI